MNRHEGRKFACKREMGNNEFSWSGLIVIIASCIAIKSKQTTILKLKKEVKIIYIRIQLVLMFYHLKTRRCVNTVHL